MISLEQELKNYFMLQGIPYYDHSESFKRLDYGYKEKTSNLSFYFDAKEKRQSYNMRNWQIKTIPQEHLFIIDDLAARKVLAYAPKSGLIIRDNTFGTYFLFTVLDLFLMSKIRVNRPIKKNIKTYKGKWLIDLRNGKKFDNLADIFNQIREYLSSGEEIFFRKLECYGQYYGEKIEEKGITRKPKHWDIDISETR